MELTPEALSQHSLVFGFVRNALGELASMVTTKLSDTLQKVDFIAWLAELMQLLLEVSQEGWRADDLTSS